MAFQGPPLDLNQYPKLTAIQVGHLRHFHNLAFQQDGEWNHMGSQEPAQEFLDAYRYQLATMAYGAAAAHFHRMPAIRSAYKALIRQLIHKMLLRATWGYWFNTSHSGKVVDPSLEKLREPWADPVVRENIMYSGHLLLMISLYAMLFDDDEFEKPESIVFDWNPIFWGERERFTYDVHSLQKAILTEMERNKWVGVCCEPNSVFVVCNQFPLIAMRLNDVRDGTNLIDEVLAKYKAAWEKKGLVMEGGLFPDWWMVKQDVIKPPRDVNFTAWACAFMNSWNHELVASLYAQQSQGFITNIDGEIRLQQPIVANAYRQTATSSPKQTASGTSSDSLVLSQAIAEAKEYLANPNIPKVRPPYYTPALGYVLQWLSELGKDEELEGLLKYADNKLRPTWEDGGLYYPRNDTPHNEDLELTHMDSFTGNSAIGYSRLNVKNGQKIMWENPWTKEDVRSSPWVDGLDFGTIAITRGVWDLQARALVVTVQGWNFEKAANEVTINPVARNLPFGHYLVYIDGQVISEPEVREGGSIETGPLSIRKGQEVDLVFINQGKRRPRYYSQSRMNSFN